MKTIGIYAIFRKSDDKCMYIGQSKYCEARINGHFKYNSNFNEYDYYGEVIEEHNIDDNQYRLDREAYWINKLKPELNIVRNRQLPHEIKQKISNKCKGYKHTEEAKQKIREANIGKQVSEDTRQKISKIHKGKQVSEDTRQKISKKCKGYKHTEEAKQKISMNHRRYQSEETRKKISEGHKGKGHKQSEETRKKISETMKRLKNRQ